MDGYTNVDNRESRTQVVILHGNLGLAEVKRIEAQLPEPNESTRIVIDCADVESLDSSVLALFMQYRRRLQIAGGDASNIVIIATPRLERLFDLTGICRAMTVVPSERRKDVVV